MSNYMQDYVAGEEQGAVGTCIVLPATHSGYPRDMVAQYQDAMAVVARYGKPDYFITMTANAGDLALRIFGDILQSADVDAISKVAILTPKNKEALNMNKICWTCCHQDRKNLLNPLDQIFREDSNMATILRFEQWSFSIR